MTHDVVLPAGFVERMKVRLGPEAETFFGAMANPPEGLRVNTLRVEPAVFERLTPVRIARLPYPPEGYRLLEQDVRPGRHPYHAAGLYYLQDPTAMVVGALVGASPGERVLDLSAAPGGKATHLAARMEHTGILVANDVDRARATELARNLERCGVTNALVTCERPDRLADHFGAYFDRVLVDAPCSGESMFHKSAAAVADWSHESVIGCARRQSDILATASRLVAPGGVLVYSTCTFSEEENEGVATAFLAENPAFEPAVLPDLPGGEPVRLGGHRVTAVGDPSGSGWAHPETGPPNPAVPKAGRAERESPPLSEPERSRRAVGAADASDSPMSEPAYGYRLWPHRVAGAGHFVVAFRKPARDQMRQAVHHAATDRPARVRKDSLALLDRFLGELYPELRTSAEWIVESGDELFQLPHQSPSIRGLCMVRRGLWLGSVRRGRFEPAHALALAVPARLATNRVDLAVGDPRTERYLAGHPIEDPGEPGWAPVCVDGFALGWGKRVGRTVKNHYPKGLRSQG